MKVALCTPCGKGYVHHDHMFSVARTFELAAQKGIELRHQIVAGNSLLPYVRNYLVAKSLHEQCDYIFFIDDDIAWDAKDFVKLIDFNLDLVAAAPAKRHKRWDEAPNFAARLPAGNKMVQHKTPLGRVWEVDGLATAFMCIKASVFAEIEHLTQQYFTKDDEAEEEFPVRDWFWLDKAMINGRLMGQGEDYNFCSKWVKVGGQIFLDPDIRLRHYDGGVCFDFCPADLEDQGMKLVIALPTRGRPELLIKSLRLTVPNIVLDNTWLVVMADDDDKETINAVWDLSLKPPFYGRVSINIAEREDTIAAKYNRVLEYDADVYCLHVDHQHFQTKGFDKLILDAAALFPDGIGVVYNHMANASFPHVQAITAGWAKITGEFYPEYFPYWFVDHWLDDVARIVGRISFADVVAASPKRPMTQELREPTWWATWFDAGYLRRRDEAHSIIDAMDEPECNKARFKRHHPLIEFRSKWVNQCVMANQPVYEASRLEWDDRYKRIRSRAVDLIPWLLEGMDETEAAQFKRLLVPRVPTFGRVAG